MPPRKNLRRDDDDFDVYGFVEKIEAHLRIDENTLEDELKAQPEMRQDVGVQLALAVSRRDQVEKDLKILKAEVARDYRKGAAKENEKPPPAHEITDAVTLDKEVKGLEQVLIDATRDVKLLEATRDSVKDRGYALGRLTDLWLERYYDREGVHGSEDKLKNKKAERAQEKIRDGYREERRARQKEVPF